MKVKAILSLFITGILVRTYMAISRIWASSNRLYHTAKGINSVPSLQGHEKTAHRAVLKNNVL